MNKNIELEEKQDQKQLTLMNQNKVQDAKKENDLPPVSFFQLFRFATSSDKLLMIIGAFFAVVNGICMPFMAFLFGQVTDSFAHDKTPDQVVDSAGEQSIYFIIVGSVSLISSWIQMSCWMISGERQAIRYRKEYFNAILNQEIGWFDAINPNELATKVAAESFSIQGAIGEKVPTYIMTTFMCIGGFIVGYTRGWKMSLVVTAALPVVTLSMSVFIYFFSRATRLTTEAYSKAGGKAEQAINAIKTVKSLNGEDFELANYSKTLVEAWKINVSNGLGLGFGLGLMFCFMFLDYSLGFWYGSKLVEEGASENVFSSSSYTAGDVITIFFSIMIGGFSLGQTAPCLKSFAEGKQAAAKIFQVLDRQPKIINDPNGKQLANLRGRIEFKLVEFKYPMKNDITVLKKVNLLFEENKKTALVGESGSGKSTIMQLIERFYDPDSGNVELDGINIKETNLNWLRENIGYVGQEPVLFATTIRENLKYGKENATEQEMIDALIKANAWIFVSKLSKKLDTFVGHGGGQFSGGLCIARAILKNPKILLLDEATSALDRKNEKKIQSALDNVSKGRTTIVIAHRLTTIQNADKVIVLDQGAVVEEGTHQSLINAGGRYEALAKNQFQNEQNKGVDEVIINGGKYLENNQQQKIIANIDIENNNNQEENQINQPDEDDIILEKDERQLEEEKRLELEKKNQEELKKKLDLEKQQSVVMGRLLRYNKPETIWIILGSLSACANGLCFPLVSYCMSHMIDILSNPSSSDFRDESNLYCLYFLLIGILALVSTTFQMYFFSRVGESLTLRIRIESLKKILRMPGKWFDIPQNNPGTLTSRLAADAQLLNQLTSSVISIQIQNLSSFVIGLIIAFYASWAITLITLGLSPLMIIAGQLQMKFVMGYSANTDEAYKDSGNLVMEAVTNIRTVASFGNQRVLLHFLDEKLKIPLSKISQKGHLSGFSFGFSQFIMFSINAIIFYVGAILCKETTLTSLEMFQAIFAIMFAAQGAGNNNHFMGDVGAAKNAAINLFNIIDSQDEFDLQQQNQSQNLKSPIYGNIEFKNVKFKYPNREKQIFNNLSFTIQAGQKIAFVGPSGCGKSTIMQLLMRFYDIEEGQILIEGKNIKDYDIHYLRSQYGVVQQEPILFQGTIKENIQYNQPDVAMVQIEQAAAKANALQFIQNNQFQIKDEEKQDFGTGFDRVVGPKGSQISGGQKQRIAIARAILYNPKILLLDEATSALDSENEALVQQSLNQFMLEKTSLTIAHRISTIVNSDTIYVVEDGNIVEQGTYKELVDKKNYFYRLERGEN